MKKCGKIIKYKNKRGKYKRGDIKYEKYEMGCKNYS